MTSITRHSVRVLLLIRNGRAFRGNVMSNPVRNSSSGIQQTSAVCQSNHSLPQRGDKLQESRVGHGGTSLGLNSNLIRSHCSSTNETRNCYYEELVSLMERGDVKIIEVRRPDELAKTGKMECAFHIQLDDLYKALEMPDDKFEKLYGFAKPDPDDPSIVFTCRSGNRSRAALEIAKQFGYTKARHYPGGWLEWAEKNNLPNGQ